ALRRALDEEIVAFDPQIIHCEQLWLFGHLALESGVPYVLVVHDEELVEASRDARYERLAQEAAENAGRIVVPRAGLAEKVRSMVREHDEHFDERIEIVSWVEQVNSRLHFSDGAMALAKIYERVLNERHGHGRES